MNKHTPVTYDPDTQLTSRFCVCRVGGGYSVEDKRTGERVSYHETQNAAIRHLRQAEGSKNE